MDRLTAEDPSRIGPYRIVARLGAGGMGLVYLARSEGGRTLAIKVVQGEFAQHPEFRRRFAREVAAARRVGGEWTADVLDADTEAETPWVATQYVPGPDLHSVVAEQYGPLPEHSVRVLANRLALALRAVHGAGLVHRDLKPSNVLVTVDGPRVIDFGIARALDSVTGDSLHTRTGVVIGSPGFMSPEQVRGLDVTPASDVFCLGAVLAYAATGRQPFGAADRGLHAQMFRVAEEEPDLDGVPESLLPLVRECLTKDPDARPTVERVAERTVTVEGEEWLPGAVLGQLGRHAAQLLDFDALVAPAGSTTRRSSDVPHRPADVPRQPSDVPHRPTVAVHDAPTAAASAPVPPAFAADPPAVPAPSFAPAQAPVAVGPDRPGGRDRKRRRPLLLGAVVLAVLAAGGGLVALQPWEKEKGKGAADGAGTGTDQGAVEVPTALQGPWEGTLEDKVNGKVIGHIPVRLDVDSDGAKFSWMDSTHTCTWDSPAESTSRGPGAGEHELSLGTGDFEHAEPEAGAASCPPWAEATVRTQGDGRLTWEAMGKKIQFAKAKGRNRTEVPVDVVGDWRPEPASERQHNGYRLEALTIPSGTLAESAVLLRYRGTEGNLCHYKGGVFSGAETTVAVYASGPNSAEKSAPGCPAEQPTFTAAVSLSGGLTLDVNELDGPSPRVVMKSGG
ncbi:serine/threonine protein kinase [Streptomyces sp. NA04227]|uniref:serine/threonine-protein kinase n=1 Tax=Streptomyces sp. NA04227 TaxID=2742136 RepID=UPI0015923251|nr:serine/threonine-protein kinase [Streptomyces sp. NA04227]QKW07967.1 serine/threonine protein kinase [Streptomyces sp. NA04227]